MLSFFLLAKSLKGERVAYEVRGGVIQNDKMSLHCLPWTLVPMQKTFKYICVCVCGCLKVSAKESWNHRQLWAHLQRVLVCEYEIRSPEGWRVCDGVCVCNLHANIWLSDILFWERPYAFFPLFFYSTAHIIQSRIHTRSHDYNSTVSREPTSIPPPQRVSYSYLSRSGMQGLRYIPDIHLILICQPSILLFLHLSQWNTQKLQNTDEESLTMAMVLSPQIQ